MARSQTERQLCQLAAKNAQKNRSEAVSLGRFSERCKTLS
jgi:hypothetical protein